MDHCRLFCKALTLALRLDTSTLPGALCHSSAASCGSFSLLYTAYTSTDGQTWIRGGTWQHSLGSGAQIGIAAENTPGFTINFDYVRVYTLK